MTMFSRKTYGTCQILIQSASECWQAASLLGYDGSYAVLDDDWPSSYDPAGCYVENSRVHFATPTGRSQNTGQCSSRDVCICRNYGENPTGLFSPLYI